MYWAPNYSLCSGKRKRDPPFNESAFIFQKKFSESDFFFFLIIVPKEIVFILIKNIKSFFVTLPNPKWIFTMSPHSKNVDFLSIFFEKKKIKIKCVKKFIPLSSAVLKKKNLN